MLNIISKSVYSKKSRGPQKVVNNLILGLEKIKYPYVINKRPKYCKNIWIHDDISYLKRINKKNINNKVIIGPNLFVNPENIPVNLDLSKYVYLQPSEVVKKIWIKRGYRNNLMVWPVGIDTEQFDEKKLKEKNQVLVYYKKRDRKELENIKKELENKNIKYSIIEYGKYRQEDFLKQIINSKYIIWLGCYESQGIALEEVMCLNVPLLVIDNQIPNNSYDIDSTSAPYFDENCGIKIKNYKDFHEKLDFMENNWKSFRPREFIIKNLSIEKQASDFIKLLDKDEKINKNDAFDFIQDIRNSFVKLEMKIKDIKK